VYNASEREFFYILLILNLLEIKKVNIFCARIIGTFTF